MQNTENSSARLYWLWAWLLIAAFSAVPLGRLAYRDIVELNIQTRHRFIVEYELWRAHPKLNASPQHWARSAARLLTDNQIMNRLRIVHPDQARQIELDYRRDLTLAQVIAGSRYLLPWSLLMALLYGAGLFVLRPKKRVPPPKSVPASYNDPRYRE